ncbi:GNAT family N-acetyltransferase [Parahaliea maris]|uniref:GNAT family N-acetyltransferase n=2 Tax=Parahaliea maris TaxID=2716870 RepID=A0A5C8ZQU5_9GAMM|nr:GNAT family N-acetyltransferase [Parahaliea maris]
MLTRATIDDLPQLLELIREFCAIDGHTFDEQRLESCLPDLLHTDDYGLVWLIGEPFVGYAVITWGYSLESGGREALIDEIYLRSRGQGLGSRAIEAILDDCRSRGVQMVFLETETRNTRARSFYTRAGFTADDSIWMSRSLSDSRE